MGWPIKDGGAGIGIDLGAKGKVMSVDDLIGLKGRATPTATLTRDQVAARYSSDFEFMLRAQTQIEREKRWNLMVSQLSKG